MALTFITPDIHQQTECRQVPLVLNLLKFLKQLPDNKQNYWSPQTDKFVMSSLLFQVLYSYAMYLMGK